ncbi:hypothetical protein [Streptosporangium sp. NPDC002524]|uniref:hypothetical protein n=1 Tax=Streptosporangium sp. NPDC002524 TaxID=3154537 RepID=UPI00331C49C3
MIPSHGTPVGDRLNAATWRSAAVVALQRLRTELHTHRIYPAISYDEGQPRLVVSAELTVWADRAGTVFCWGAVHQDEPAEHVPVDDLVRAAGRIAGRLGGHYAEPVDPL